jgi:hypothetical protein
LDRVDDYRTYARSIPLRLTVLALLVSVAAFACGCDKKKEVAPPPEEGGGIDVQAPGVDVEVKPGEGVEVKAPGTDVEAKPGEGADVNVDADAPN